MNHASFDNWAASAVNPPLFGDTLLFSPISAVISFVYWLRMSTGGRTGICFIQLYPSIPIQSSSSSDVSDLSSSTQPSVPPLSCQPSPPFVLLLSSPFSCQISISFIIQLLFHTKKNQLNFNDFHPVLHTYRISHFSLDSFIFILSELNHSKFCSFSIVEMPIDLLTFSPEKQFLIIIIKTLRLINRVSFIKSSSKGSTKLSEYCILASFQDFLFPEVQYYFPLIIYHSFTF